MIPNWSSMQLALLMLLMTTVSTKAIFASKSRLAGIERVPSLQLAHSSNTTATEPMTRMVQENGPTIVLLAFQYDCYDYETFWTITDSETQQVIIEGPQYFRSCNDLWVYDLQLQADKQYRFTVYDTADDGITGGYFILYQEIEDSTDFNVLASGTGDFASSTFVDFTVPGESSNGGYDDDDDGHSNDDDDITEAGGSDSGRFTNTRLCPDDNYSNPTGYQICLDLIIDSGDSEVFESASKLWSGKVIGDLEDINTDGLDDEFACSAYPEIIDDLYICGKYDDIDGEGFVLGHAIPTYSRTSDGLPLAGFMAFDSPDIADLKRSGTFEGVILHEMGHALGLGSLWEGFGLTRSGQNGCPYSGENANREWQAISGCTGGIPIEADGGEGTRCVHWDEECLNNEIMTGQTGYATLIFSRITIGGLEDLGYDVDYSQADSYTADDINPLCRCGRRALRGSDETLEAQSGVAVLSGTSKGRKLSAEGQKAAHDYGQRYLKKMKEIKTTSTHSNQIEFIGDRHMAVFYKEEDHIYRVHVTSGERQLH